LLDTLPAAAAAGDDDDDDADGAPTADSRGLSASRASPAVVAGSASESSQTAPFYHHLHATL